MPRAGVSPNHLCGDFHRSKIVSHAPSADGHPFILLRKKEPWHRADRHSQLSQRHRRPLMSQPWFALATNPADVTFITNGPWKTFDLVVGIT